MLEEKDVEYRNRPTNVRGQIAIYASLSQEDLEEGKSTGWMRIAFHAASSSAQCNSMTAMTANGSSAHSNDSTRHSGRRLILSPCGSSRLAVSNHAGTQPSQCPALNVQTDPCEKPVSIFHFLLSA
jgi:hypothetical protein